MREMKIQEKNLKERYEENNDEAREIFFIYMLLFFMNTTNNYAEITNFQDNDDMTISVFSPLTLIEINGVEKV